MAAALTAVGVERRALVVSGEHEPNLVRAARNIDAVQALPAANLNIVDLVNAHRVVLTEEAVRKIEALWGGENTKPARGRREVVSA
jgi:large subunit ribosomal protein L4